MSVGKAKSDPSSLSGLATPASRAGIKPGHPLKREWVKPEEPATPDEGTVSVMQARRTRGPFHGATLAWSRDVPWALLIKAQRRVRTLNEGEKCGDVTPYPSQQAHQKGGAP